MPTSSPDRPELLQGTLDLLVLRVLRSGPNHGYGVAKRLREASDEVILVEEGSLYPALHRLEKRGFVESEWRPSDTGRRAKYYRLTAQGTARLAAETQAWNTLSDAIDRVLGTARVRDGAGALA